MQRAVEVSGTKGTELLRGFVFVHYCRPILTLLSFDKLTDIFVKR